MPTDTYTELWLEGPLSTAIYTRVYKPPPPIALRASLIFVHGYLEHVDRHGYVQAHTKWASRGVAVLTFDQRGFGRTALNTEHRSPGSAYGRTGGSNERMADLEWAIKLAKSTFGDNVPIFLMGHSMAGGTVLGFATLATSPAKETIALLSGVISSSPLIRVGRKQPSWIVKRLLNSLSKIFPNMPISTPPQDKELSRDPTVGEAALKDPWIKGCGSAQGISDMIQRGEYLLQEGYKLWPSDLPVLILQGDADVVNAFPPTKAFYELLKAPDKEFIVYEDAWHDLISEPDVKDKYFEDILNWIGRHSHSKNLDD
ncbi:lysophospholipase [Irpex rosettiformis]|uniref:Lysophospholipase n=1 Tax=Irpex rosettiformis TaxID=378272 RepID=A0ACB8TQC1_9APHY|nr:lysophospholipase [Irpex rosettiformis]